MTALLLAASLAAADDTSRDAKRKLETRISLDLRETKLSEAIDVIRSATGLNFVVQEGGDLIVTMKIVDVGARSVLRLLLQPRDLVAVFESGAVVIRARRGGDSFSLRLYDVRGGTARLRDFPGTSPGIDRPVLLGCFPMVMDEGGTCGIEEAVLLMLIRSHTGDPRAWDGRSEGSLSIRNGILVVRQTSGVHREIESLLKKLGL